MTFGPWEIPDSEFTETAQRLERARKISPYHLILLDTSMAVARILGSEGFPYEVSLDRCDCVDFQRRGLPCKHMLRLALELGKSFDIPQFDPYAAANYDVEAVIEELTQHWRCGELTLDALSKCTSALRASAALSKRPRSKSKKK